MNELEKLERVKLRLMRAVIDDLAGNGDSWVHTQGAELSSDSKLRRGDEIETLRDLPPSAVRQALLNTLGTMGYTTLLKLTDAELAPAAKEVALLKNDQCKAERARHISVDFRGGYRGSLPFPIPYLVDLAETKALPEHLIALLEAVGKDIADDGLSWQECQALDTSSLVVAVEKFVPSPGSAPPKEARTWLIAALGESLLQDLVQLTPKRLRFIGFFVVEFEGFKTQEWYWSRSHGPRVMPAPPVNMPAIVVYCAQAISEQCGTELLTKLLPVLLEDLHQRRSTWTAVPVAERAGFWFRDEINTELGSTIPSLVADWFADQVRPVEPSQSISPAVWLSVAKSITRTRQAQIRDQEFSSSPSVSPGAAENNKPPRLLSLFSESLPEALRKA